MPAAPAASPRPSGRSSGPCGIPRSAAASRSPSPRPGPPPASRSARRCRAPTPGPRPPRAGSGSQSRMNQQSIGGFVPAAIPGRSGARTRTGPQLTSSRTAAAGWPSRPRRSRYIPPTGSDPGDVLEDQAEPSAIGGVEDHPVLIDPDQEAMAVAQYTRTDIHRYPPRDRRPGPSGRPAPAGAGPIRRLDSSQRSDSRSRSARCRETTCLDFAAGRAERTRYCWSIRPRIVTGGRRPLASGSAGRGRGRPGPNGAGTPAGPRPSPRSAPGRAPPAGGG